MVMAEKATVLTGALLKPREGLDAGDWLVLKTSVVSGRPERSCKESIIEEGLPSANVGEAGEGEAETGSGRETGAKVASPTEAELALHGFSGPVLGRLVISVC